MIIPQEKLIAHTETQETRAEMKQSTPLHSGGIRDPARGAGIALPN